MSNIITKRFIECHNHLKETGSIRSSAAFAADIGTHRQTLNDILKGRREVKTEMIQLAIEKYYFNPFYLFSGTGDKFTDPNKDMEIEEDNIKLVPIRAQAGYSDHILDPVYQAALPSFRLPIPKFRAGDFVGFEVEGESMYPTLEDGDLMICSELSPNYYAHTIKDDKVYVIVTREEVLVKRVLNKIHSNKIIVLQSDNQDYSPINMRMEKVKEVWKLEGVFKNNLPKPKVTNQSLESKLEELITAVSSKTKKQ